MFHIKFYVFKTVDFVGKSRRLKGYKVLTIINDPYFRDIPGINKKANEGVYYFHATDDVRFVRLFSLRQFRQLLLTQRPLTAANKI
jgi:hypothetical protein